MQYAEPARERHWIRHQQIIVICAPQQILFYALLW
jgi:hypothetical protein